MNKVGLKTYQDIWLHNVVVHMVATQLILPHSVQAIKFKSQVDDLIMDKRTTSVKLYF